MLDNIMETARKLNKSDVLPEHALRRNSLYYPLVSYVNHSIALLLSESYDEVALFVRRAQKEKSKFEPQQGEQRYFSLVEQYLDSVSNHLKVNRFLSRAGLELLEDHD